MNSFDFALFKAVMLFLTLAYLLVSVVRVSRARLSLQRTFIVCVGLMLIFGLSIIAVDSPYPKYHSDPRLVLEWIFRSVLVSANLLSVGMAIFLFHYSWKGFEQSPWFYLILAPTVVVTTYLLTPWFSVEVLVADDPSVVFDPIGYKIYTINLIVLMGIVFGWRFFPTWRNTDVPELRLEMSRLIPACLVPFVAILSTNVLYPQIVGRSDLSQVGPWFFLFTLWAFADLIRNGKRDFMYETFMKPCLSKEPGTVTDNDRLAGDLFRASYEVAVGHGDRQAIRLKGRNRVYIASRSREMGSLESQVDDPKILHIENQALNTEVAVLENQLESCRNKIVLLQFKSGLSEKQQARLLEAIDDASESDLEDYQKLFRNLES